MRNQPEREAINMEIQGSASDLIKMAMLGIFKELKTKGLQSRLLMQIHDELVFDALKDEVDALRDLVKHEMESAMTLGEVPILVETGVGENWQEAH